MSDLPGRNDPCYCGSGKKYKQCHMKEDQQSLKDRLNVAAAVQFLRRDMLKYTREEKFAPYFAAALPHYWNNYYTLETADEMSEEEALRFFDWYLFDYIHTNEEGQDQPRIIEQYAQDKWDQIAAQQQAVVTTWLGGAAASGYELLSYDGQLLELRDIVADETYTVYTSGGRGVVEIGEIILVRILPSTDHIDKAPWSFSSTGAYLPADEIGDIVAQLAQAKETYMAANPEADLQQFMRRNNYRLIHHALAQAVAKERPPVARLDPNRPDARSQKIVRQMRRFRR